MSRDELLAYKRGYNAGRQGKWPDGVPPYPPEPVVRRLMQVVVAFRGGADALQAVFGPDDEVVQVFFRMMDEADEAVDAVGEWLGAALSSSPAPREGA